MDSLACAGSLALEELSPDYRRISSSLALPSVGRLVMATQLVPVETCAGQLNAFTDCLGRQHVRQHICVHELVELLHGLRFI